MLIGDSNVGYGIKVIVLVNWELELLNITEGEAESWEVCRT